jgi:predicted GNAT superfamily acetyltransferase
MRITVEETVDERDGAELLAIYKASFAPLETLAAGRQSLSEAEFRAQLADRSVLKFVGRGRDGTATALALVATDLSAIPWISPPYFEARFPDHFRRHAIYYVDALAVAPNRQGGVWAYALLKDIVRMVARDRGIAAFDCCQYNEDMIDVPALVASVGERLCHFEPHHIDTQRYYAYVSSGLRSDTSDEIDLTDETDVDDGDEVVIDLVALETAEREQAVGHQHEDMVREH